MDNDKISRESYKKDTDIFGKLAKHEDYQRNLSHHIKTILGDNNNLVLLEAGAGLGRHIPDYLEHCKSIYLTDLNESMINRCREKYNDRTNMKWFQLDHGNLGSIPVEESIDVILGTYTFGHFICACDDGPKCAYQHLVREFLKIRHTKDTEIIISEVSSINNNDITEDPRLSEYYACLTRDFGQPQSISTDFKFENAQEASHIMGRFFGKEAENDIRSANVENKNQSITIPESTYLWRTKLIRLLD